MLARAAQRKLRRDAFPSPDLKLSAQLVLPWLCPAQMRWAASVGTITHDATRKQKLPSALSPRHETIRSLATAAELQPSQYTSYPPSHTPRRSPNGFVSPWGTSVPDSELAKLPLWDSSKPLVIHDSLSTATPVAKVRYGIGGDPIELHQNLHACIRVGRLDRAMAIVQRLTDMYSPSAPDLVDAHNTFLRAKFEVAQQNSSADSMADIEEWYHTHMVKNGMEPNADTFVTLLRASFTVQEPSLQERSIRVYLDQARKCGPDVLEAVNASHEFTDDEWDTLIRLQPDLYNQPPPTEEVPNVDIQVSTPEARARLIEHGLLPDLALALKDVPQKGFGLETIKQALNQFQYGESVPYPHEIAGSPEEKDKAWAYMRQIRLENDSTKAALERWKVEDEKLKEMGIHGVLQSKPIQALMWNWCNALTPALEKEIQRAKEVMSAPSKDNANDPRHQYGPYLEQCSAEKLAALTVSRVIQACASKPKEESSPLKISRLSSSIGKDIEDEVNLSVEQRTGKFVKSQRNRTRKDLIKKLRKVTKAKALLVSQTGAVVDNPLDTTARAEFPLHIKIKIGALALENLLQAATITVTAQDLKTGKTLHSTQPAFHHHSSYIQGKRIGSIAPHHEIEKKLRAESVHGISMVKLPMLVEPKPWKAFDEGGYYTAREFAVRTKVGDNAQTAYAHSAIEHGDMDKVLAGLDVLGKVPWTINSDIYRVAAEAWNTGEGIGKLVPEANPLTRPEDLKADATHADRAQWLRDMRAYENATGGFHSQRCFQNFQLEVARAFMKEKHIYFPHSVDFRGRAYPMPPILNHIGADLARGLLKFGNGKELGIVGLQWLKVHLANLFGFDKASLKDREEFTMTNLDEIYDSATNPLGGRRWWTKAADPWQCLSCCMELKNALDSPDPTRFLSHLPVHQDGTCNGLQHYAALGGDLAGASQVNLEPSDKPQDIYSGVADLVRDMLTEDAAAGNKIALFMEDKVTRKLVKRTVMTNVYGVTFMGAKLQVLDELKVMFPDHKATEPQLELFRIAMYIVTKIFKALGKIFNGAQEIQYWLGECGDRITTSITPEQIKKIQLCIAGELPTFDPKYKTPKKLTVTKIASMTKAYSAYKTSIIWTTPLKMPVVQPYRKESLQAITTSLQSISVTKKTSTDVVDKRRQLQAFPPNFIHSLDATHMLLSALKCSEMGLDFAAVHDSFWTHAADIPNLNIILRDAFVRMHSEDIMGRLAEEFKARYAGSMYCASLIASTTVAQDIQAWRRQYRAERGVKHQGRFGAASNEEIALEAERQELLKSEDEAERAKGRLMTTPTSIWLAAKDPLSLSSFRLALLGDTKEKSASRYANLKEKVLGAEAEAMRTQEGLKQKAAIEKLTDAEAQLEVAAERAAVEEPADIEAAKAEAFVEAETHVEEQPGTAVEEQAEAENDPAQVTDATLKAAGTEEQPKKLLFQREPRSSTSQAANAITRIQVWLPLTFPPVPKKGGWDVKRLRESKYFFS